MSRTIKNNLLVENSVKENNPDRSQDNFQNNKFTGKKLWKSEECLRVLMNSNPEAVFILNTEGNFIATNEKTTQRFCNPIEKLIGTNVYSYLVPFLLITSEKGMGSEEMYSAFNYYLKKPFTKDELFTLIGKILDHSNSLSPW